MAASGGDTEKCWEPMASCPQSSEALRQQGKKRNSSSSSSRSNWICRWPASSGQLTLLTQLKVASAFLKRVGGRGQCSLYRWRSVQLRLFRVV